MFRIIKKMFNAAVAFDGCSALKCVSMSNQDSKVRPSIVNINSNEHLFYPYTATLINVVAIAMI